MIPNLNAEWLETDGQGGFASGTISGIRTRRYHGLLLTATKPPEGRVLMVAGLEVFLEVSGQRIGRRPQRYWPDLVAPPPPDLTEFRANPWSIGACARQHRRNPYPGCPPLFFSLADTLNDYGLNHIAEIADAARPHSLRGCPLPSLVVRGICPFEI